MLSTLFTGLLVLSTPDVSHAAFPQRTVETGHADEAPLNAVEPQHATASEKRSPLLAALFSFGSAAMITGLLVAGLSVAVAVPLVLGILAGVAVLAFALSLEGWGGLIFFFAAALVGYYAALVVGVVWAVLRMGGSALALAASAAAPIFGWLVAARNHTKAGLLPYLAVSAVATGLTAAILAGSLAASVVTTLVVPQANARLSARFAANPVLSFAIPFASVTLVVSAMLALAVSPIAASSVGAVSAAVGAGVVERIAPSLETARDADTL